MIKIRLYWQDLAKPTQDRLLTVFGDNCNWDCIPMTVMEIEDDREITLDSMLGDEGLGTSQYGLICDGKLLDYAEAPNILEAAEKFKYDWPDGAFVTDLTQILEGM